MSSLRPLRFAPSGPRRWWLGLAGLLLSGLLPACDSYLVSICQLEDQPGCHPANGSPDASLSPGLPRPSVRLRRFEQRLSFGLSQALVAYSFVGLQGSPPKILVSERELGGSVLSAQVDLERPDLGIRLGSFCKMSSCPIEIKIIDLKINRLYTTPNSFFYFDYFLQRIRNLSREGEPDCDFDMNTANPYVSHRENALMAGRSTAASVCIYNQTNKSAQTLKIGGTLSSFVLADLDGVPDEPANGQEAIVFAGAQAVSLTHASGLSDSGLLQALNRSLERDSAEARGPIVAADISDINGDKLPDLLTMRNGKIRVMSYLGRGPGQTVHDFAVWPLDVATVMGPEKVQRLVLEDLNADGFPDLIVETDKNLLFFRNVAM